MRLSDERKQSNVMAKVQFAVFSMLLGLAIGSVILLPYKIGKLTEAQNRASSIYLCIETWKLGIESESCEPFVGDKP